MNNPAYNALRHHVTGAIERAEAEAITAVDYQHDYRAAQESGHHVDCDGFRTAHRVTYVIDNRTHRAVCDDCGPLHVGSFGDETTVRRLYADHAHEVACDGRCKAWTS